MPPRYCGVALLLLVLLIGIPIGWKAWESIVDRITAPRDLSFVVLPHHDAPYGKAYFRRGDSIEAVRAYPIYNVDMHQTVMVQPIAEAADVIRDGYRIAIGNPTDRKFLITGITMRVRRQEKLPARYVCAWKLKGMQEVLTANFDLRPGIRETALLDERRVIDLPPGEAQVVVARVRDAAPGVYTFYFEADVQSIRGKVSKFTSQDFRLLVPNRSERGGDARGVSITLASDLPDLVARLLNLDVAGWEKLRDASNPQSLDATLAVSRGFAVKGRDDATFVQQFLRDATLPPPGVMRPIVEILSNCTEGKDDAADCATTLLAFGQHTQAMRVLRDGLVRSPADARAAAKLIELLLEQNRRAFARQVWDDANTRAGPNADLYYAGFLLARATSDRALGERLARDTAMQFPDTLPLLIERTLFYRTSGRASDALHALTSACRYFDTYRDTERRRALRKLVRDTVILMSNRGDPGVSAALPVILSRCPSQIAWDLRSSPALWHYASMQRPMGQKPATPREGLDRARALIASGRVQLAAQELSHVDRAGSRFDAAEAQELFGDLLFRNEQYERAGDVYMRAYKLASLPKVRLEGIALKAAFAYYHAQSQRISDVFDAAGPQFLRVVKTASSADQSTPNATQMVLYDPPWEAQQTRELVWLARGFATGNYDIASGGYVGLMTSEPIVELGQKYGDFEALKGVMALTEVIRDWGKERASRPQLPKSFLAYFMDQYIREEQLFQADESASEEAYAGRYEAANAALLTVAQTKLQQTQVYFLRVRGGTTFGMAFPGKDDVFTGSGWMPFMEFQARERPRHRTAKPGVYLEKITGAGLEAERMFRDGVERAYHAYDIEAGLQEIERSIAQDGTNVAALRIAAQLSAATGRAHRCAELATRGLALDPDDRGLVTLARGCRAVMR